MRLVVTNRRKFRSFVFACICAVMCLSVVALTQGATGEMEVKQRVVNVMRGDNIWAIAHKISPAQDTRATVKQIMQMNKMDSPRVYEHQALLVPVIE